MRHPRAMDPDELANCYLHCALRLLHSIDDLPYPADCRRSALKLQLTKILGRPLTTQLALAEPATTYAFEWRGLHYDPLSEDHVVPLDAVIEFVRNNLGRFPVEDVQHFRRFISPRVVLANVPRHVNATLNVAGLQKRMWDDRWTEVDDPDVLWQRYSAIGIPHPMNSPQLWEEY